jgi:hypothetical protein
MKTEQGLSTHAMLEALICLANDQARFSAYYEMVRAVGERQLDPTISTLGFRIQNDSSDTWQGLYIVQRLTDRLGGLYCGLSAKSSPGITEWMDVTVCRWLLQRGFGALLLGGAETPGVRQYIAKLHPRSPQLQGTTLFFPINHPPEFTSPYCVVARG